MLELWIRFARRLMKLPEGDPHVPAGDPNSVTVWNPDKRYLRYRLVGFWIGALPAFAGAIILVVVALVTPGELTKGADVPHFVTVLVQVLACVLAAAIAIGMAFGWATLHLELDLLRYTLTDRAMRLRRGVRTVEEVTLSFANIQNVQLQQGPLQRYFGIADLVVETAGGGSANSGAAAVAGGHHQGLIQGVAKPDELRELILTRVKARRDAGHSQAEQAEEAAHAAPSGLTSPEARVLLREIKDALARVAA